MPHTTTPSTLRTVLTPVLPAAWLGLLLFFSLSGSSVEPPAPLALLLMAASGWGYVMAFRRDRAWEVWREHRLLVGSALALAALVSLSEFITSRAGLVAPHPMPPQPGLLECLLPLAVLLGTSRERRAVVVVFGAVTAWHFVAMPLEAIWGAKLSWHDTALLPRDAGPFHYQASGLAHQAYFFPGFFLPVFWLAWGPLKRDLRAWPQWLWLALALAWVFVAACVQSRSAMLGAVAAAALAIAGASGPQRARRMAVMLALVSLAAIAYVALFGSNKSGSGLRLAYFGHYIAMSFDRWLIVGHGLAVPPPPELLVPGLLPLAHSHNDIAQVLYSWGLLALVAYAIFLFALLRTVFTRYVARGEYWPLCALVTVLPSMVTDLGLQHYEKAALLVWLAAFCIAFERRGDQALNATTS